MEEDKRPHWRDVKVRNVNQAVDRSLLRHSKHRKTAIAQAFLKAASKNHQPIGEEE